MYWNIYSDGVVINTLYANEAFVRKYCELNGYQYQARVVPKKQNAPTIEERITELEISKAEMTEALDLLLSGVTE